MYDPSLSRWTTLDPEGFAAGQSNLYEFAGNGPTDGTDLSGTLEITRTSVRFELGTLKDRLNEYPTKGYHKYTIPVIDKAIEFTKTKPHLDPTDPNWPFFSDEQIQQIGKVLPTVISIADRLNEVGRRTTSPDGRKWLRGDHDLHQTLDNYIFYFGRKLNKVIENERARVNAGEVYGAFIQAKRDEQEHHDFVDQIQLALDLAGLIPVVGIPFTIAGTGLAASRGDWLTASLNLLTLVPLLGGAARAYALRLLYITLANQDFLEKSGVESRSVAFLCHAHLARVPLE